MTPKGPFTSPLADSRGSRMETGKKAIKEEFARLFMNPSLESLPEFLRNGLGEFPYCEFKERWPNTGDLVRHILGIANSGGGLIVIGVAEKSDKTHEAIGIVGAFKDKADFGKEVDKYLPDALRRVVQVIDLDYTSSVNPAELVGKKFQIVYVSDDPSHIPFMANSETTGLGKNTVYVRRDANTEPANYDELQGVINRRVETNHSTRGESDLQSHLDQLKVLYSQIPRHVQSGGLGEIMAKAMGEAMHEALGGRSIENEAYPKEDYQAFVTRMIDGKKRRIQVELDLPTV